MEKRLYQRVLVGLLSNFIIKENEPGLREFNGIIEDLSENGIKIRIEDQSYLRIVENISVGDTISFQSIDEYEMYGEMRTEIFSGEAKVIRKSNDNGNIIIGCKIYRSSEEYSEYVKNKKMALFMKRGCSVL